MISIPEAELPRIAEKAQSWMRLPRTITCAARCALTALPNWPEPPESLRIFSMRLSSTMVPSSPATSRRIWIPLLPACRTMLRGSGAAHRGAGDLARDALEMDAVAAGPHDGAVHDLHAASVQQGDEPEAL